MKSMDHGTYVEWLYLEGDGELSPTEARSLEEHLATCQACRGEREALRRLECLMTEGRIRVHSSFRQQVLSRLPSAGWEAQHPRTWIAALIGLVVLGGGAAALLGTSAAALEPAAPFVGALMAVFDLFRASVLAGAGLLSASWKGLGLAVDSVLSGSIVNTVALVALVVGLDLLLIRLVWRRGRMAVEERSNGRSTPSGK